MIKQEQLPTMISWASWSAVMEHVGACVYVKDREGRIVHANSAMCALYGLPWEQIRGRPTADFVDAQSAFLIRETDRRVMETGTVVHERDEIALRACLRSPE